MKRIRLIGLICMMVWALSAVTAASASAAPEFDAALYPVEWKGTNTNIHGFSGGGVVTVCRNVTANTNEEIGKVGVGKEATNPTKNSPTLIVHPIYTNCRGSLAAGTFPVEVRTTGCNYRLHAVAPGAREGSLDIVCAAGKQIEYRFIGLTGCTITDFPQNGLKSLEYKNEPKAGTATQEVTTEIESKYKSKATSSCGLVIGEAEFEGEYRQGKIGSPIETAELEPPGHPATVVFQGFAEATKAQEALEVGNRPSAPTVTNVEPHSGPAAGGTPVTITGTNLSGATSVTFGSTPATSFTVNSESSITAISPAGTETVDVTVTTPGGTSATSSADRFTYGPTVTRVEPNHGSPSGGSTVTITGNGFSGTTTVKFGSANAASFTVNSPTSITAISPKARGAETVDVTVTTPAGTSPTTAADKFTYSNK